MQTCAYCGRRLPWLHRVIGQARYCSKEHARLHMSALGLSLWCAPATSGESAESADLPAGGPDPRDLLPLQFAVGEGGEDGQAAGPGPGRAAGEASEGGPASRESLTADPVAPFRPLDPPPLPLEMDAAAAPHCLPSRQPDLPARLDLFVPYCLPPVAAGLRLHFGPHAIRPRRRVVVPSHRSKPETQWRLAGGIAQPQWLDPVMAPPLRPGLFPVSAPQRGQTQSAAPGPVVVFSFLEGVETGRTTGSGLRPAQGRADRVARITDADFTAEWFVPREPELHLPRLAPKARRAPARVQAQERGVAVWQTASLDVRLLELPPPDLWNQQAAGIQPFRLHRMPLRPLRLHPLRAAGSSQVFRPPLLGRLSLLNSLHLPKPVTLPVRPVYRWAPAGLRQRSGVPAGSVPSPPARVPGG